jgi:hypothetical protein
MISDHWPSRCPETYFNAQRREASALSTEQVQLLDSIGDPTLMLALLTAAIAVKHETTEMHEVLRLAQYAIDLAGGDATNGRQRRDEFTTGTCDILPRPRPLVPRDHRLAR